MYKFVLYKCFLPAYKAGKVKQQIENILNFVVVEITIKSNHNSSNLKKETQQDLITYLEMKKLFIGSSSRMLQKETKPEN